jgi:hypothetical protein
LKAETINFAVWAGIAAEEAGGEAVRSAMA